MDIKILHEDENLIILEKPAGLLVHPKNPKDTSLTLVSWFLEKEPTLARLNWPDKLRAGIIHRLDQDTSGLLILAKSPEILEKLQKRFRRREIKKTYLALVFGKVESGGEVESFISRGGKKQISRLLDFQDKMKKSKLVYDIVRYYTDGKSIFTLLKVKPVTGRTHQIRVQLKQIGAPIVGDKTYNTKQSKRASKNLKISRQFLHASKLKFTHPINGKKIEFHSKLPQDLKSILNTLKRC